MKHTDKSKNLLNIAKILRRNMTTQEKRLWYDFLRHYPVKIYKQRIIDNFVADFYCHKARLVIELDGSQHHTAEGNKYDSNRTKILNQYGIHVLRFTNQDIDRTFYEVCQIIDQTIQERISILS